MKKTITLAIDINESSIKVLQLDVDNVVMTYADIQLSDGIVNRSIVVDVERFSEAISEVLYKFKSNIAEEGVEIEFKAMLCVPEAKIFSYYCVVPDNISQNNEKNYVRSRAEKIIPFNIEALYWDYHVAQEGGIKKATFIGINKTDLENLVNAFTHVQIQPIFVVGELFAVGRALLPDKPLEEDYLILDIGKYTTTIGMFSVDTVPNASILVPSGGDNFMEHLSEELIEAKKFFEIKTGNPIKYIILAGDLSSLPNLSNFITEKIGIEVQMANPLLKIKNNEVFPANVSGISLTNVIGLAQLAKDIDSSHINLLAQYEAQKQSENDKYFVKQNLNYLKNAQNNLSKITSDFVKNKAKSLNNKLDLKLALVIFALIIAIIFLIWTVKTYV